MDCSQRSSRSGKLCPCRESEIHGTTRSTRAEAERREVVRQLTELYAERNFMEPHVQEMLDEDQEAQLQRPIGVTKNWLACLAGPVYT